MNKIIKIILALVLFCYQLNFAQTSVELHSSESGNPLHVAKEIVNLTPGFSYKPSTGQLGDYKIDDAIVGDVNYGGVPLGTDLSQRAINTSYVVGLTQGTASVSSSGSASFNVPVSLPAGIGSITPSISIGYSSTGGNGLLGMGWDINVGSTISRVGSTIYHDGKVRSIDLDANDNLTQDGMRLILRSGSNMTNGAVYRTELETFSTITAIGTQGIGPAYFKVETKDGKIVEYGNNEVAKLVSADPSMSTVLIWYITKISDLNGNYIEYKYKNDGGQIVLDEILFTGNINAGLTPLNKVKFQYINRSDISSIYIAGKEVKRNLLLDRIKIYTESNLFKEYQFVYTSRLYSFLTEIIEFGNDGSRFNSTAFQYETPVNAGAQMVTSSYSPIPNSAQSEEADVFSGDYTGDGITDALLAIPKGGPHKKFKLYQGTLGGVFNKILDKQLSATELSYTAHLGQYREQVYYFSDFNGDGKSDYFLIKQGAAGILDHFYINYSNGSDFISSIMSNSSSCGYGYANLSGNIRTGDFDGDGATDILTYLSNSSNTQWEIAIYYPRRNEVKRSTYSYDILNLGCTMIVSDVDSDGKNELFVSDSYMNIYEFDVVGSQLVVNKIYDKGFELGFRFGAANMKSGDFNGDGKTDFFTAAQYYGNGAYNYKIHYSKGKVFGPKQIINEQGVDVLVSPSLFETINFDLSNYSSDVQVADYNGDGKSDILIHGNNLVNIFYSNGRGFSGPFQCAINPVDKNYIYPGDYNGDGRVDELYYRGIGAEPVLIQINKDNKELLLKKTYDGFNNSTEFTYSNIANPSVYSKNYTVSYPLQLLSVGIQVVATLKTNNGNGGVEVNAYQYSNALIHKQGKGFLGFQSTTTSNISNNIKVINLYQADLTTHYTPILTSQNNFNLLTGSLMSESNNEYYFSNSIAGANYFSYLKKNNSINYLTGVNSNIVHDFDALTGNLLKSTSTTQNQTTTNESTFSSYGNPVSTKVTTIRNIGGVSEEPYIRNSSFTYDVKGNLLTQTIDPTDAKKITNTFTYNSFGQVLTQVVTASGVSPISTSINYNNKGLVTRKYNPQGQYEEYTYDGFGRNIKVQDVVGLISEYTYDGFNRLVKVKSATGVESTTKMGWDIQVGNNSDLSSVSTVYYSLTQATASPSRQIWFDSFGREKVQKVDGVKVTCINRLYDNCGNVRVSTFPYFSGETPIKITNSYDEFNRIKLTQTDGIYPGTTYNYSFDSGNSITTMNTPEGQTTTVVDPGGKTLSLTDNGGTLNYKYYSSGNLKSVEMGSVIMVSLTYDLQGNKIEMIDKNAGTISYTYDTFGRLLTQTDNGKVSTMVYDQFGKMISRNTTEGTTTYDYNTSGMAINQIKKITGLNGHFVQYDYTSDFGRVQKVTEQISSEIFITQYQYNSIGQQISTTYPSGFIAKNQYTSKGELYKITDNTESISIWERLTTNQFRKYTSSKLGNGLTTTKTFNAYGFPVNIKAGSILDLTMDFNSSTGNLNYRKDNLLSLTESFTYDNLNRLTGAQVNNLSALNVSYANNGNINNKSDAGGYVYDQNKINAVAEITNPQNIPIQKQEIYYTSFNKAFSLEEGPNKVNISYGVNNERIKAVISENNVEVLSRYYLPDYEKSVVGSNTTEVTYISTPDGVAAIHVKENGVESLYYVYTDHLGTPVLLTKSDGSIVYKQSFDAWGRKRNPNTWDYELNSYSVAQPKWLYRGFTGHEMLPQFSLINMNGRMYDPVLGRMLSPDVQIQNAGFSQNYNRYSYAWNNPLKYTDPSGNDIFTDFGSAVQGFMSSLFNASPAKGNVSKSQLDIAAAQFGQVAEVYLQVAVVEQVVVFTVAVAGPVGAALVLSETGYDIQKYLLPVAIHIDINLGTHKDGIGIETSIGVPQISPLSARVHGGVAYNWKNYDVSPGWEFKYGGEVGITPYLVIGSTRYNSPGGKFDQTVGSARVGIPYLNIKYENDWFPAVPIGDNGDRYRTASVKVQAGPFSLGFNLFTGDAGLRDKDRKKNIEGPDNQKFYQYNENTGANPDEFRAGVGYYGILGFRFGDDKESRRGTIQNDIIHHWTGNPYYHVLDTPNKTYFQFGGGGGGLW